MLDFCDQPYRYFPPRYNALMAGLIRWVNRRRHLPKVLRIRGVELSGEDAILDARRQGARLMLVLNHATHADAAIMMEAMSRVGVAPQPMAAYDVFLRGLLDRLVMQWSGAFSVDREGSDSRAMKQAAATLEQGRFALAIFPEGNVYLTNDVVTPFHDGAAFLALRAVKDWPADRQLRIVPVSIKATLVSDVRESLLARLRELAKAIDCSLDGCDEPVAMIHRVGVAGLLRNLRHRGIAVEQNADVASIIRHAAEAAIAQVERKLGLDPGKSNNVIERVRAARRRIHEVRIDPQRVADHAAAATWADEAMLAFRIASYSGSYLNSRPTLDRIGETIEKLCEDAYNRLMPPIGDRHAFVHFGQPLDVRSYLERVPKLREAVRQLTADCETAVQQGIDAINARNTHLGAQPWADVTRRSAP